MFLLFHPKTRPTGRTLRDALGIDGGTRNPGSGDVLIRWGCRRGSDEGWDRVLNSKDALKLASDKLAALTAMQSAGVRVPKFTDSKTEASTWEATTMARTRHGARGEGITVVAAGDPLPDAELYTQYVECDREYRIHVALGQVIRVQVKVKPEPGDSPDHIRNHKSGYVFRGQSRPLREERLQNALKAVEALGLDFGAVDLVIGTDGHSYVLEVNTAPSCSPLTLSKYVEVLSE